MKRDPQHFKKFISFKDDKIHTGKNVVIEIPTRYQEIDLFELGDVNYVYGVAVMIDEEEEKYSVILIPAFLEMKPVMVREVERFDNTYYQLQFAKNTTVVETTSVTRNNILVYDIFNDFYLNGKVPWFMEYRDLITLLIMMEKYANSNIGANMLSNEFIVSYMTRLKKDPTVMLRYHPDEPHEFKAITDIYYSTFGTLNKISGAYFTEGLVSALVNKEDEPTAIENIVRA